MSAKEETSNSNYPMVGFAELLTFVFIVLKLCGVIDWSWWWVISPLLISIGITLIIIILIMFVGVKVLQKIFQK